MHIRRNPYLQISYNAIVRNSVKKKKNPPVNKDKIGGGLPSLTDTVIRLTARLIGQWGVLLFRCLHVPSVWLKARLLHGSSVDDMCCQLSGGEDSLLRYRLFPAWLGTERVTGQGVYWNTVFSSAAAAAVQLQYSRNIVLLCGCFPRPAP